MYSLPTYPFQRQRYLSTYDGKVALFIYIICYRVKKRIQDSYIPSKQCQQNRFFIAQSSVCNDVWDTVSVFVAHTSYHAAARPINMSILAGLLEALLEVVSHKLQKLRYFYRSDFDKFSSRFQIRPSMWAISIRAQGYGIFKKTVSGSFVQCSKAI